MGARASEVIGIQFGDVSSLAVGYAGSAPLPGVWVIREVVLVLPVVADPAVSHTVQFGAKGEVPSSSAEMSAAEVIFPFLRAGTVGARVLDVSASNAVIRWTGRFRFEFKGRRLVMAWGNGAGVLADASALFVMEREGECG